MAHGDRNRADTIRRNAFFALLAQLSGAAFTAGLTVFLARELGTSGFGVLSLALGIGGLVLLPTDFGVSNSAARFVAEHRGERARVTAVVADSLRLKLLAGASVAALLFALARPIASAYSIGALTWPLRGIAIALFGQSLMMLVSVFAATANMRLGFRSALLESATEATATIALVLAGTGVTGAAFGRAIGYLVGAGATVLLLAGLLGREALPSSLRFGVDARRIATYAGVLLIIDGAYTAFSQLDILVIGGYLGARGAGIFSAPLRFTAFLAYPGSAVAAGVAPRLARSSKDTPNVAAFTSALRLLTIVQAIITAFVLAWAPLFVRIGLGGRYGESSSVLRALAPYIFLNGFGALVSLSVNYLGQARRRVAVAVVTVLLNLVLDLVLVPRIGVNGGAVGTDVAYALYAPAHLVICQRMLRIDLRPAARTVVRTALAAAAMTGTLLLLGDPLAHPWLIALAPPPAAIAFAAVLWATGELSVSEARAALAGLPLVRRLGALMPARR